MRNDPLTPSERAHENECGIAAMCSLEERGMITKKDLRDYLASIGSKGGKTKGKSKRRPAAHYERLAAMKRKKPDARS